MITHVTYSAELLITLILNWYSHFLPTLAAKLSCSLPVAL